MRVRENPIPVKTIEAFAEEHDLTMVVNERPLPAGDPTRFYALFDRAEVKGHGVLIGTFGNGATPEDAIAAYAEEISLKVLVIGAYTPERKEVRVPRLAAREEAPGE